MFEFRPQPKPVFKKKTKVTPYTKNRAKKRKNPHLYRGRFVPSRKERTEITPEQYHKMIVEFGEWCLMCGHTPIDAHHIVFRSQFGSGNYRNLAPLCPKCHERAHRDREFADTIREMRAEQFGPDYYKDVWSLFKEGKIPNTTDEAYERYMREEERKATEG